MMNNNKPACIIRQAKPEDAMALPEIERSAVQSFLAEPELHFILDMPVMSAEQHMQFMQSGHVLVVECDAVLAGFLVAEPVPEENGLHIWELSVHQTYQRRGVGRALLDAAASLAQANGYQALSLTTFCDVVWNKPFYERCGFVVLPVESYNARFTALADLEQSLGLPRERRVAMVRHLIS